MYSMWMCLFCVQVRMEEAGARLQQASSPRSQLAAHPATTFASHCHHNRPTLHPVGSRSPASVPPHRADIHTYIHTYVCSICKTKQQQQQASIDFQHARVHGPGSGMMLRLATFNAVYVQHAEMAGKCAGPESGREIGKRYLTGSCEGARTNCRSRCHLVAASTRSALDPSPRISAISTTAVWICGYTKDQSASSHGQSLTRLVTVQFLS